MLSNKCNLYQNIIFYVANRDIEIYV